MAFINEYISEEDRKKYNIDAINERFIVGGTNPRQWTIEKEKNTYLMCVARGREEFFSESTWIFFWEGNLIELEIKLVSSDSKVNGPGYSHKEIKSIKIPESLKGKEEELLRNLKEAFLAYKDGGILSSCTSYSIDLTVAQGE